MSEWAVPSLGPTAHAVASLSGRRSPHRLGGDEVSGNANLPGATVPTMRRWNVAIVSACFSNVMALMACDDASTASGSAGSGGALASGGTGALQVTAGAAGSEVSIGPPCEELARALINSTCNWWEWELEDVGGAAGAGGASGESDSQCFFPFLSAISGSGSWHLITVALDCEPISFDPADPAGGYVDDPAAPTGVVLGDSACTRARSGEVQRVDVIVQCCF